MARRSGARVGPLQSTCILHMLRSGSVQVFRRLLSALAERSSSRRLKTCTKADMTEEQTHIGITLGDRAGGSSYDGTAC